MDLWLWSLCFLPVAGALRILPEVKMEGMLGGSITIECPLPQMHVRLYLCREIAESGVCATVVSNKNFVKEEYKHRVTLKPCPDRKLFLVEVTELTKSDSGIYACGTGMNTDRGKTQQVTLSVHSEYDLFWEEEPMPEPPSWFHKFLHMPMPPWFKMPPPPSSFEFIPKVVTPAPRTEAPPAVHSSPPIPISHHLRVSRASSVAASKPPTLLPSTIASKTSAPEALPRPQTASYNYHTRLHRQRAFHQDPVPGLEDQGFHILVPTTLALILLALLGLLMKRVIQRRKGVPPLPGSRPSAPPVAPQASEVLWLHAPSLKTSCDYVSCYREPAANAEDTDSDDYVNIPYLTHLSSCPPGPRPWCQ
ncbi:immunoglobulin mu Fc receptor isoform X3 [Canis lupus baileyi]|uniref:fas apoptotic inhibitory molecule 3 isoform X3 n=1 Tax=Canis lupus dingo TaxID=286419 RepID=UPI0015F12F85|nr:fas apoptotic inhibitory molecule 3 isoform X3 [Canis lupus dingo]XP_038397923.1 fas apoptotic inhibitory molecule 3 isoform X3 [Canis lupus familiaris]XP_038417619.1 fas apoptotic inhibitory molecule 3 isoform X3 [Canis lupus familiaris]XP_038526754.1 fas apoptotic inhibitory molecule 3 isoform X3 [Canis lupus familiaris]